MQAEFANGPAMARHTLLVVDDEPDVVKSVQDLLRLDYRVLGSTSATKALELMHSEEVHVVMTDQRMPEMTGVEFLSRVRGEYPEAIRLLFTGYADIRAVIDAINQGNVYRYITKPWDPEELQSLIREAIERFDLLVERKKLVAMLQRQNRELEQANAELSRASTLKSAFIQVASHELRTPLTILLGLTELTALMPASGNVRANLGRIDHAGRRMQKLVDQIVTMLSTGRFDQNLDRKPTDLAPLLNEAADDVRPFIEIRHQNLALDLPRDLGSLPLDGPKLRDSINHLLLNAIKFTPDGGNIALRARHEPDGSATIEVSDTGSGIDEEAKVRLFEPFFTGFDVAHHSSGHYEHMRKGLGLGLSIVRAWVEMHGGTISVESETGHGSTFTIRLPNPNTTTAAEPAPSSRTSTTTPER
jgi:signal transduction histidine kinase